MKPIPPWFPWVSFAMALLLGVCVVLQVDDPDPVRWMVMYGAGAAISLVLPSKRAAAWLGAAVGLAAAVWAGVLLHEVWGQIAVSDLTHKMSEKGGAVEVGREAGGLAIEAVWLLAASAFRGTRL